MIWYFQQYLLSSLTKWKPPIRLVVHCVAKIIRNKRRICRKQNLIPVPSRHWISNLFQRNSRPGERRSLHFVSQITNMKKKSFLQPLPKFLIANPSDADLQNTTNAFIYQKCFRQTKIICTILNITKEWVIFHVFLCSDIFLLHCVFDKMSTCPENFSWRCMLRDVCRM